MARLRSPLLTVVVLLLATTPAAAACKTSQFTQAVEGWRQTLQRYAAYSGQRQNVYRQAGQRMALASLKDEEEAMTAAQGDSPVARSITEAVYRTDRAASAVASEPFMSSDARAWDVLTNGSATVDGLLPQLQALPYCASSPLALIRSYLQQQVAAHQFSGDVLVAVHDRVIFEQAYGDANIELHVPNTLRTRFRIFSVTKPFIAAAVMTLAQQGKLDVFAPAARYLQPFPQAWSAVTLAELLNHSSGVPRLEDTWVQGFFDNPRRRSQCENYDTLEPRFAHEALANPPGALWAYNNFGYDLLGCVVERTSGMSPAAYMDRAIFRPAGMIDSGLVGRVEQPEPFYDGPRIIADLATGYNGTLGVPDRMQQAMPKQYASAGAGDMYSTVDDLWRYSEALYHGEILAPATQREMLGRSIAVTGGTMAHSCNTCGTTRRVTARNVRWGLGWGIVAVHGHTFMEHSGGNNGYTAEFARFPDEHATIIVLSNYGFAPVEKIRAKIAALLFNGKYSAGRD